MAGEYKFHVRDDQNAQWVNILKDSQIEVVDDNNTFPPEILYVSEALDWLAGQVGGSNPGYAGAPIHCTDDVAAVDVTGELASITTRGGIEVYKNVIIGGNNSDAWGVPTYSEVALEILSTLDATNSTDGALVVAGGVGIAGKLYVGTDIEGANLNVTTLATLESLAVGITGVASDLLPDANFDVTPRDIGADLTRWNTLYVNELDTNNLTTAGDLTGANLNTAGTTTTGDLIVNGNITVDPATEFTGDLVPATGTQALGSLSSPWAAIYVENLDVEDTISGTFNGSFTGDLIGNVSGTANSVTADNIIANVSFQGDIEGNVIGDWTEVTSGWDTYTVPSTNMALEVRGGVLVDKSLEVGGTAYIGGDLNLTGSITAGNLNFAAFNSSIIPDVTDTHDLGSDTNRFNEIHAVSLAVDSFSATTLTGDLVGNVLAENGVSIVLENGTTGFDAVFTGDVTGDLTGDLAGATTNFFALDGENVAVSVLTTTDQLSVTTSVNSDLVPETHDTLSLGSLSSQWNTIHAVRVNGDEFVGGSFAGSFLGDLAGDLVGTLTTATGNMTVQGDLTVDGTLTAASIDFGSVAADITGDVYADDTTSLILENGTDGTDAVFTGSVTGDLTGDLLASTVNVTSTTASTSWENGALVVAGGVGIAGKLYVQEDIQTLGDFTIGGSFNVSNFTATSLDVTAITSSTSPATGALRVTTGGLGVWENINAGGYIQTEEDFFGDTLTSFTDGGNLTLGVRDTLAVGAVVDVTVDMTTLGITTTGDVDVTGDTTLTGNFTVEDNTLSNTVDINVATDISGILTISNTTGSTDKDTGALIVEGGVGIEENLNVGGTFSVIGDSTFTGNILPFDGTQNIGVYGNSFNEFNVQDIFLSAGDGNSAIELRQPLVGDPTIQMYTSGGYHSVELKPSATGRAWWFKPETVMTTGDVFRLENSTSGVVFNVTGEETKSHIPLHVYDTTQSIDKDTGSLIVEGGVGIEKDLFVGGDINGANNIDAPTFTGTSFTGDFVGSLSGTDNSVVATTITAGSGGFIGDLNKITQIDIPNQDPAKHNGSGNNADIYPDPAHQFGDGQVYISGGTKGRETGASMSVNGNIFLGGDMYLDASGRWLEDELNARQVENGFRDINESTIAFDDVSGQLTVTPVVPATGFTYYSGGQRFTKVVADSNPTPIDKNIEGIHYFYYVGDLLVTSPTFSPAIISTHAFVAAIYWSSAAQGGTDTSLTLAEERHGNTMSNATHSYLHATRGSRLAGGGALAAMLTDEDGSLDTHVQFDVAGPVVTYDEDIRREFSDGSPQQMIGPARLPIWYRQGTNGGWRKQAVGDVVLVNATATNIVSGVSVSVGGTGYNNGSFTDVETTAGSGDDTLTVDVTIAGGIVTSISLGANSDPGRGYTSSTTFELVDNGDVGTGDGLARGNVDSITASTTGRPVWNEDVAGTWSQTEMLFGEFMPVHIVATNDVNDPIVAIMGQSTYTDLNSAYEGGADEAGRLEFGAIDTLSPEWVFLGTIIVEANDNYTNAYNARFRADVEGNDYIDLRGSTLSPSGGTTADDHAGLSNLQGGTVGAFYHADQAINKINVPNWAGINIDWNLVSTQPGFLGGSLTLTAGKRYLVDSPATTIVLPATPLAGQSVHLTDTDDSWGSTPITLDRNTNTIEGAMENMTLNVPGASLELVYTGSTWKII
jgi:hypothetical protein